MIPGEQTTDFSSFHETELPGLLEAGPAVVIPEAARPAPLAIRHRESGTAYTYRLTDSGVVVESGETSAATVVCLGDREWRGLIEDQETAPGLLYSDRVVSERGSPLRFMQWEHILRTMFHGRPIYPVAGPKLRDRLGAPLDVGRRFRLGEDSAVMAQFLDEAGYAVVAGVFKPEEVDELFAATESLRTSARPGDGRSWWGRNRRDDAVLCRVTHGAADERLKGLYADERILRLGTLSLHGLVPRDVTADEGVQVLWKQPDLVEGLGDIPWHRDCGMGGHATMCPLLIATVCVTGGSPGSGSLRMLPGSWRYSYPFTDIGAAGSPEGVELVVEPGDVTLHYSDMMHASSPPTGKGPFRTSVLLAFVTGGLTEHRRYNTPLTKRADGQVEHLRDYLAHSP